MLAPFGIIPAMVTPLTKDDKINEPALRKLTNYLVEGGVHGLFGMGSQGEFWAYSAEEKRRVWNIVVEESRTRVPVYAGTAAGQREGETQVARPSRHVRCRSIETSDG